MIKPDLSVGQFFCYFRTNVLPFLGHKVQCIVKAINNGSASFILFLSTTGLFPAGRKLLQHETQSSALTFF